MIIITITIIPKDFFFAHFSGCIWNYNFLFGACKAEGTWTAGAFIDDEIAWTTAQIKETDHLKETGGLVLAKKVTPKADSTAKGASQLIAKR